MRFDLKDAGYASPPPNGHWTNTYFFNGGFAVKVWLG